MGDSLQCFFGAPKLADKRQKVGERLDGGFGLRLSSDKPPLSQSF
jgi:hypothetical protein